ncbi:MAG: hypothetical protein WCO52_03810 [bacterium]
MITVYSSPHSDELNLLKGFLEAHGIVTLKKGGGRDDPTPYLCLVNDADAEKAADLVASWKEREKNSAPSNPRRSPLRMYLPYFVLIIALAAIAYFL